jgi:WD40 repeat protein
MRILAVFAALLVPLPLTAAEPKATIEVPEKLVLGLAYSPDGKILASSGSWVRGRDIEIHLWDTTTNKELKVLKTPRPTGDQVECVQFSPDGNVLCTGPTPRLWNLKTGKVTDFLDIGAACVSFNSDGKTVAASCDGNTIRIWNVSRGKEQARITEGSSCALYTPDGKTLVYGTGTRDGKIKLWDYATGKERAAIKAEADQVNRLACTNDTIAYSSTVRQGTGWLTTVHLIDFMGKELRRLKGHDSYLMDLAFTADGKFLATASDDRTVRLWDVGSGKQLASFPAGDCWTLALSPDGKTLATGTREKAIKLWDISERTKK